MTEPSTETTFEIGADGINTEALVRDIRQGVEDKLAEGFYSEEEILRAERSNFAALRGDKDLSEFYLNLLAESACVDINDFEINEKRTLLRVLLVPFKRLVWKVLRFYTFRLWSQQNEVNALLLAAVEATEQKYDARIRELERTVATLKEKPPDGEDDGSCQSPSA